MDLKRIFEPVRDDLGLVEGELKEAMVAVGSAADSRPGPLGLLRGIVQHPFTVPGKRMRPALLLLAARAARVESREAANGSTRGTLVKIAAAVEVLHAASLVHDDIIDGADSRRHQVSLNKRFGNRVAVLAGDILYTHFFSLITRLSAVKPEGRIALLELFIETTKAMCMGEILAQEAGAAKRPLGFEEYIEISADKTASLFSAACEAGAVVAGADSSHVACLRGFGLSFGLTFQMVDDIMDQDHGLDPGIDLMAKAREYAVRAKDEAGGLPDGDSRDRLRGLIDYVLGQAIS